MSNLIAQNSQAATNIEFTVQNQTGSSYTVHMENNSNAYSLVNSCSFIDERYPGFYLEVVNLPANYFATDKGFVVQHGNVDLYVKPMYYALNRIKIFSGDYLKYSSTQDLYFNYDIRECTFYACGGPSHDVTMRVVKEGNYYRIWFYDGGHNAVARSTSPPSVAAGWKDVSQSTVKEWELRNVTNCNILWETEPPTTPQGFYISGNAGQSPTLRWNNNEEPDLDGYRIYQSIDGVPYSLLTSVSSTTTSFTDNGVTISGGYFDPLVCYKISAYDDDGLESEKTLPKCVRFNELSKETFSETIKSELFNNRLYEVYPNPFNPTTNIKYELAEDGNVYLAIYDILGKEVKILINEFKEKGAHIVRFDANGLSNGIYIYTIRVFSKSGSNDFLQSKRLTFIK